MALGVHSAKPLLASQFPALCRGSRRPYPPAAPPPPRVPPCPPGVTITPRVAGQPPAPRLWAINQWGRGLCCCMQAGGWGGGCPLPPAAIPSTGCFPPAPAGLCPTPKPREPWGGRWCRGEGVCVCVSGPCRGEQGVRRGELLEGKGGAAAAGGGGVDPPLLAWGPRGATFVPLIAGGRGGRGGGCVPGVPRLLQLPPPPQSSHRPGRAPTELRVPRNRGRWQAGRPRLPSGRGGAVPPWAPAGRDRDRDRDSPAAPRRRRPDPSGTVPAASHGAAGGLPGPALPPPPPPGEGRDGGTLPGTVGPCPGWQDPTRD